MSFALTTDQVRARTKTVTRRIGWKTAKVGDVVQPVEKCQGLKKGEKVRKIGGPIRFVSVTWERLDQMRYAPASIVEGELLAEGVSDHCDTWQDFLRKYFWPQGCHPDTVVTRIKFEYVS